MGTNNLESVAQITDKESGVSVKAGEYLAVVCESSTTADEISERLGGYQQITKTEINGAPVASFSRNSVRTKILAQEKSQPFSVELWQHILRFPPLVE